MINCDLTVKENVGLSDISNAIENSNFKGTIITGRVQIEDRFGNLVLDKNNLVVLQGRGLVLRKLFSHSSTDTIKTKSILGSGNADIKVTQDTIPVLFTVGSAGVNSVENPSAFAPKYDDKTIVSVLNSGVDIISDGVTKGKRFSSVEYVNDSENNECYVVLTLTLSGADFNGSVNINEAGILFGEAKTFSGDKVASVANLTLMSRITFDSIPINAGDSFTIKYYLYA